MIDCQNKILNHIFTVVEDPGFNTTFLQFLHGAAAKF